MTDKNSDNSNYRNPRSNQNPDEDDLVDPNQQDEENPGPKSLKDELEIEDLSRCIFFKDSKIFAAAGPKLPLLQVNTDGTFVALPMDKPYRDTVDVEVLVRTDEHGRMLDALGEVRKLTGMKYKGKELFFISERHPENNQNLAAWFDDNWVPHRLYLSEALLSAAMVLRIRNRMIDGELSTFPEITSD